MRTLYAEAWEQLKADRQVYAEIERECTPVLVFGQWQTATVMTAGLNPSEDEFRDKRRQPLPAERRRFLHWPDDGLLAAERLEEAFSYAEGYFTRGNAYTQWFNRYAHFLDGLGVSFVAGTACHTDYISPFATRTGIAACGRVTKQQLPRFGLPFWKRILEHIPNGRLVVGHGSGYRQLPGLLDMEPWQGVSTPYDQKGGRSSIRRPYLLFSRAMLSNGKTIALYWWKPNRNGSPLEWLNDAEKAALGRFIRQHAEGGGVKL